MTFDDRSKLLTRIEHLKQRSQQLEHTSGKPTGQEVEQRRQEAIRQIRQEIKDLKEWQSEHRNERGNLKQDDDMSLRIGQLRRDLEYLNNPDKWSNTYTYKRLLASPERGGRASNNASNNEVQEIRQQLSNDKLTETEKIELELKLKKLKNSQKGGIKDQSILIERIRQQLNNDKLNETERIELELKLKKIQGENEYKAISELSGGMMPSSPWTNENPYPRSIYVPNPHGPPRQSASSQAAMERAQERMRQRVNELQRYLRTTSNLTEEEKKDITHEIQVNNAGLEQFRQTQMGYMLSPQVLSRGGGRNDQEFSETSSDDFTSDEIYQRDGLFGGLKCGPGEVERAGYHRRAYERRPFEKRSGIEVKGSEVKETNVGPTCIKKYGKSHIVKGRETKGPKLLPPVSGEFHLRDFGYSEHDPPQERHQAIIKAMQTFGPLEVERHMVLINNKQPYGSKAKETMRQDVEFAKQQYHQYRAVHGRHHYYGGQSEESKEPENKEEIIELKSQETCHEGQCEIKKEIYEKHNVKDEEFVFRTLNPDDYNDISQLIDKENIPDRVKESLKNSTKEALEKHPGFFTGLFVDGDFKGYFNYRFKPKSDNIVILLAFRVRKRYRKILFSFMDKFFKMSNIKRVETDLHSSEAGGERLKFFTDNGFKEEEGTVGKKIALYKEYE
jgi:hypothetical protein